MGTVVTSVFTLTQAMLSGLVRLKSLDLSSNKLQQIGGALDQLTALEHLNLRDNALLAIDAHSFRVSQPR